MLALMPRFATSAHDYLRQLRSAAASEAEFRRRLEAEGFELGEGVMGDCIVTHSQEESDCVTEIWHETCGGHK